MKISCQPHARSSPDARLETSRIQDCLLHFASLYVLGVWSHSCCQRFFASFENFLQQLFSSNTLLSLTFMDLFCSSESCNSISEFCSLCTLERRGQMMLGFARWYFTIGMTTSLVQSLPWQWGTENCICNACVLWLMDLLVLTRLLISETKFVRKHNFPFSWTCTAVANTAVCWYQEIPYFSSTVWTGNNCGFSDPTLKQWLFIADWLQL